MRIGGWEKISFLLLANCLEITFGNQLLGQPITKKNDFFAYFHQYLFIFCFVLFCCCRCRRRCVLTNPNFCFCWITGDDENQIFVKFFKFHKCYDLIPTSAKLVVFDTQLLVKKAFFALVHNGTHHFSSWLIVNILSRCQINHQSV